MVIAKPLSSLKVERDALRNKLMSELTANEVICCDIVHMGPVAFAEFCGKIRATGLLKDFRHSTVEEQLAKFLHILGQNFKNRALGFYFHRSGETISRHFHNVLRAVVALEAEFLSLPNETEDGVGALDGTHIQVKVPKKHAPRFRGRKEWPIQNVLVACSLDLKFTYVLPGWEGTASDSRILKNGLVREDKLVIPQGKFYLVDAGLPLRSGLLAPYRGVRYHLNKYSRCGPRNAKELFNHHHASFRNVIERVFDPDENLIAEVDRELVHVEVDHHEKPKPRKWMYTPINNYDKLFELYGEQRATSAYAKSAREKVRCWRREGSSSQIDLSDTFDNVVMSDSDINWSNEVTNNELNSLEHSLESQGSSSRVSKCKASMMEMLERQYERLDTGIKRVSEVVRMVDKDYV
ncbi:hypothetical protein GH714_007620 [Hevea brasiliensis]|uniref:Uncharacterized protein n=1 Tax=Hevea brasiliensis TaxID=3981 RepID=A0A6A6MDI8_HEVBR|nr:hypothetical protein GH714_007620 [Hevea brasiliensis]